MSDPAPPALPVLPSPITSTTGTLLHRDHIAETVDMAATYAGHAGDYARMGDDRALNRAVRMLCACAAHAADALPALAERVEADQRLMAAARTAAEGQKR